NHLEDWMLVSARQRLDIARCRCNATVLDFCFASASGTETGRNAIDPHLSIVQPDPVTGQSDHTLHPDLRSVTWPSKYDNVASFGQRGKDARRLGKDKERGQRGGAVTIWIFCRQQFVANQKSGLHRPRRHLEWAGDCGLSRQTDEDDNNHSGDIPDPATAHRAFPLAALLHRTMPFRPR